MQIPKSFKQDLDNAYHNAGELNKLLVNHKPFLMRLVRHALRHNHWAVISDEDDLYQEACIWLVDSLWEWDETRGTPLAEFIVYNIGVRIKMQIIRELRIKRRPNIKTLSLETPINSPHNDHEVRTDSLKDRIPSPNPTPEELYIVKEVFDHIERDLPLLARQFLESLFIEDGNFATAARNIINEQKIRKPARGMSDEGFRQITRKVILSQIRTALADADIIHSVDDEL